MKIAVSADGEDLDAAVHERFGRCPFFLVIETDDMTLEVIENIHAELLTSAGVQSAGLLASKGVAAVITGNCGPKAMQVFDAAGIPLITGRQGTLREVVDAFKQGALNPVSSTATSLTGATPHRSPASFNRPGMGRGMGGGCGRGMGRRCAPADGAITPGKASTRVPLSREDQLVRLRRQADDLQRQMAAIQSEIEQLS